MTAIPERARLLVATRDRYLCVRCGMRGTEWHHRRTRSVRDSHTHCPCNGVLLCGICHRWVHANPFLARPTGLMVSRYCADPTDVPLRTHLGLISTDHDGGFVWV